MKLLVFLAKGFETIEFSAFIDVMGWAKTDFDCKIDVVTCGLNQKVISSFNVPVLVDKVMDEVSADGYDHKRNGSQQSAWELCLLGKVEC